MVKLNNKLPWNPQEYVPPRSHAILEEAVKARMALNASIMKTSTNLSITHGSDPEAEAEEDEKTKARDTGYGVFPLLPGKAPSVQYLELPIIIDRYYYRSYY